MSGYRIKWIRKVDHAFDYMQTAPIGTIVAYGGEICPDGWEWWMHPDDKPTKRMVRQWLEG